MSHKTGVRPELADMLTMRIGHPAQAAAWLRWLVWSGLSFHLDDDPGDIVGDDIEPTFSDEEAALVRERVAEVIANGSWGPAEDHHGFMAAHMLLGWDDRAEAEKILALARAAYPASEEDWGSERQIGAINAFQGEIARRWPRTFNDHSAYADWCLKATDEEMVDEALGLIWKNELWNGEVQVDPMDLLRRLVRWDGNMGGFEAPVWDEARRLVQEAPTEPGTLIAAFQAALASSDLDEAALLVQRVLGVKSGDVAAHYFTGPEGESWAELSSSARARLLRGYVDTELAFLDTGAPDRRQGHATLPAGDKLTDIVVASLSRHPGIDELDVDGDRVVVRSNDRLIEVRLIALPGECPTCHEPLDAEGSCLNSDCDPGMPCCPGIGCPVCRSGSDGT